MYSPAQSVRIQGSIGQPLPNVYRDLDFQRGQVCLICAAPAVGKSVFTLNLTEQTGLPALYFSADSDHHTQMTRLTSMKTGRPVGTTAAEVLRHEVDPRITSSRLRFVYDPQPSLKALDDNIRAFDQLYGEPPAILVVDNVTNVDQGEDEDLNRLLQYLHDLGRETEAAVFALHHVTGPYNDGDKPVPRTGVKDQVGRIPEVILTLFTPGPRQLGVCKVKVRNGPSDPMAQNPLILRFDTDTMRISDYV